ncbi:hypothetical protein OSCI_3880003 [Kamptonema sp. PCC 6506]|nr:hypothetical protein OSCI_3880003 [Kamptonema sp. PCC 6506]
MSLTPNLYSDKGKSIFATFSYFFAFSQKIILLFITFIDLCAKFHQLTKYILTPIKNGNLG